VQLLAEGESSKEVATILGITTNTVDTHRSNLMRKLNCHSVTELIRYAIRNHIVEVYSTRPPLSDATRTMGCLGGHACNILSGS
jgi:Bacterial regulatory proteins, luxR family